MTDAAYESYHERLKTRQEASKAALKDMCPTLLEAGITKATVRYDGYGDSGTIEDVMFFKGDEEVPEDEMGSLGLPMSTRKIRVYANPFKGNDGEETKTQTYCPLIEQLTEYAYDFLPGGWEINEGSFGDLQIDTKLCTVVCEHNHRIETSEYQEESFEL